ncbi:uncharacterized protein LOC144026165 [Festucalex cinctus]
MESKIIAAVSEHPELYDTSCCEYRDIAKRNLAWITVSKEVGLSVETSRRKWKGLRDTYLKQRKKEQGKTKWMYSQALSFLDPFVVKREASGNMEQWGDGNVTAEDEVAGVPQEKENSENGKWRYSSSAAVCEKDMKIQQQLFHHLKRHDSSAPAPIPSKDELFLISLVPSLQRLPSQQKERVKFQIHKLIYEAIAL